MNIETCNLSEKKSKKECLIDENSDENSDESIDNNTDDTTDESTDEVDEIDITYNKNREIIL